MSLYKFNLAHFSGCYVGVEATTLQDAKSIYRRVVSQLNVSNNSVVKSVEKKTKEIIYEVKFD